MSLHRNEFNFFTTQNTEPGTRNPEPGTHMSVRDLGVL